MRIPVATLSSLVFTLTTAAFAGPISSNGPTGQELLHCKGQIQISSGELTEIEVGVAPRLNVGLVAKVSFAYPGQPRVQRTVIRIENDLRGLIYSDDVIGILVPNVQPRDLPPGEYRAILTLNKTSSVLNCKNF